MNTLYPGAPLHVAGCQIDWSKAPEGATAWDARPHADKTWMRRNWRPNRGWDYWGMSHWIYYGEMPEEQERQMIHRPPQQPWTGEGLPPVGTVCELSERVLLADSDTSDWFEAGTKIEIGGHAAFNGATGPVCAVCVVDENFTGTLSEVCLRPIRTPEQIAAEERENELNRMVATVSMLDKGWARKVCAGLYDAGYRKQPS